MRIFTALVLASAAIFLCTPDAHALVGDRLWVVSGPKQLKLVSTADPTQVAQTLDLAATVTAFGLENDYTLESLCVDPSTGNFYALALIHLFLGDLEETVRITRATGAVVAVNSHDPIPGALLRVNPVTGGVHLFESAADTVLGVTAGGEAPLPAMAFAAGDAHFGSAFACAGIAFTNTYSGATTTTAFALDAITDSLCTVDVASGAVHTVGALGVDLVFGTAVQGPVIDIDGTCRFATDLGNGLTWYSVDLQTGAATSLGAFPSLTPLQDFSLDIAAALAIDADEDGYPTRIEEAAGSDPFDADNTPFPGIPAPEPTDAPGLVKSMTIRLDFAKSSRDRLEITGRMPLTDALARSHRKFIFEVGGELIAFTTSGKGKARAGDARLSFGKRLGQNGVAFRLELKRADLAGEFSDEGLIDADVDGAETTIDVSVWRDGALDLAHPDLTYKAKAGKSGRAKTPSD